MQPIGNPDCELVARDKTLLVKNQILCTEVHDMFSTVLVRNCGFGWQYCDLRIQ